MRVLAGYLAALVVASGLAFSTAPAAADSSGSGSCDPYIDGTVIVIPCSSGASTGAGGGSGSDGGGAGTVTNTCTFAALDRGHVKDLGLPWPPPQGKHWAMMDCIGGSVGTGPQAVLVSNVTGEPQVAPEQLLVGAVGQLDVPYLRPATAPPRGTDGLVGLPEWFWVPAAEWHARSVTVTAGPVWATVTAAPVGLTIQPGAGLSPVNCAGPGTAYNRHKPAAQQHTNCSYSYLQPSVGQPGNAYRASLTVTWRISWVGSGGAGGVLDAELAMPAGFGIPVAQGEALVTSR